MYVNNNLSHSFSILSVSFLLLFLLVFIFLSLSIGNHFNDVHLHLQYFVLLSLSLCILSFNAYVQFFCKDGFHKLEKIKDPNRRLTLMVFINRLKWCHSGLDIWMERNVDVVWNVSLHSATKLDP